MSQSFYGHGKLLLTGEYFVLDGAEALAVPTKLGQRLSVKTEESNHPTLHWKSHDEKGKAWLDAAFAKSDFSFLSENDVEESVQFLQKILKATRKLNPNFCLDGTSTPEASSGQVFVETHLEFPRKWGLGSSSTLIHCLSEWAEVNPFELLKMTFGGSGYDLACAGVDEPILYRLADGEPIWKTCEFLPTFAERLFFVYLGKKQNSREGIRRYREMIGSNISLIDEVSQLTNAFLNAKTQKDLEYVIEAHERLVGATVKLPRAKDLYFKDFEGEVKSLGAWGGDFVLMTNPFDEQRELEKYISRRLVPNSLREGFETILSYEEMIYSKSK